MNSQTVMYEAEYEQIKKVCEFGFLVAMPNVHELVRDIP